MDEQTIKRWLSFFGYWLAIFTVCLVIALSVGCTPPPDGLMITLTTTGGKP